MAEETAQEKTEEPTEKRYQDAREKGEVARSRELTTVLSMLTAVAGILVLGVGLLGSLQTELIEGLKVDSLDLQTEDTILTLAGEAATNVLWALAPLLLLMLASVFVSPMLVGGLIFRFEALEPKLERIDPLKGLGRIFSVQGLMELIKALGKFVLISVAAYLYISWIFDELLVLGMHPLKGALKEAAYLIGFCVLAATSVLVLVAAIDVPFQIAQYKKKLRMTRQEVKDELKETEGRPEVKSRLRALQQEAAQRRMMEDVKTADVVVRNPTHFAVALKYSDDSLGAPVVIAKGQDLIALAIIEVAEEHNVAVFSAPPLARALYTTTELGQEIPANLYLAVAKILAYVFHLKTGEFEDLEPPSEFDVPAEYYQVEQN